MGRGANQPRTENKMNRTEIEAEIARIESATPSKIEAFNASRLVRLVELRLMLTNAPATMITVGADDVLTRWDATQRRAANEVRNQERRGY